MTPDSDDDERRILVPKKFGWGWTLNFSRPASWLILLLVVALVIGMTYFLHF